MSNLSESQKSELALLSSEPFGRDLAAKVAKYLKKHGRIAYNHRDYCGMGLFYFDNGYLYTAVDDGHPVPYYGKERGWYFDNMHSFIDWLADQSDYSLSNFENPHTFNNQTITKTRLQATLHKARANPVDPSC